MSTPLVPRMARVVLSRLAKLEARVAALEQLRQPRDTVTDAKLLGALALTFGETAFSVRDIERLAQLNSELATVIDGAPARAIGPWLRRLHGQPHGQYELRRAGRYEHGGLWVLYMRDRHTADCFDRSKRTDSEPL